MARQLDAPPDQIRVLFAAEEAERFVRGWALTPSAEGDDPLRRAIQRVQDALAAEFASAVEHVELLVEPAPWVDEQSHVWYAVNFRFADEDVRAAGVDPTALGEWIADHTPDLVFAVEGERGTPLRRGRTE